MCAVLSPTHCWHVASRDLCLLPVMPMPVPTGPVLMASDCQPQEQVWGQGSVLACSKQSQWLPTTMLAALPIPCGACTLGMLITQCVPHSTQSPATVGQMDAEVILGDMEVGSSYHGLPGWQGNSHSVPLQVLVPGSFLMPSQAWNLLQIMASNEH